MILEAPAKLNLCLYVGPVRDDGLHEICSVFAPISLADRLTVTDADVDEVSVPAIAGNGPDLTARALTALRRAGWNGPGARIEVEKRIPVAAGLGGGSADAAAVLRLARGDLGKEQLDEIAAALGADVTSQLDPRFSLIGGAGERVEGLTDPAPFAAVLIADPEGLPTPDVYAEADRLGSTRDRSGLNEARAKLRIAAGSGAHPLEYRDLLVNDLAPAAISLRPPITSKLNALDRAGAEAAIVTGSGPTAVGLFRGRAEAEAAAWRLRESGESPIVVDYGASA